MYFKNHTLYYHTLLAKEIWCEDFFNSIITNSSIFVALMLFNILMHMKLFYSTNSLLLRLRAYMLISADVITNTWDACWGLTKDIRNLTTKHEYFESKYICGRTENITCIMMYKTYNYVYKTRHPQFALVMRLKEISWKISGIVGESHREKSRKIYFSTRTTVKISEI